MAGEVKIAIVGDAAQLRRVLSEVSDDLDKQGKKTEDTGRKMQAAGAVSMAAGGLMFAAMSRAAGTASDLNEAVSQTDVIFGDAAGAVSEFAQGAVAIGQSERAAREAAGQFGLLFTNVGMANGASAEMSISLTQLASDAASFKNTSPEEAVAAFGSALRGESEPIRQYGVMLDEASVKAKAMELGLVAAGGELDNAAKVQARYALILEQSSTFQGDFARTSDGLANQQRITAAETENATAKMGDGFVPVMQKAQAVAQTVVGAFGNLDQATGGMASTAAIAAAGILVLGGGLSSSVGTVMKMRDSFSQLSSMMTTVGENGERSMSRVGAAVTGVGAAIAAAGIVYSLVQMSEAMDKVSVDVEAMSRSSTADLVSMFSQLEDGSDRFERFGFDTSTVFRQVAADSYGTAVRIRDAMNASGRDVSEFDSILAEMAEGHKQAAIDAENTTAAIGEFGTKTQQVAQQVAMAAQAAANATAGNYALGSSYRFAGEKAYDAYQALSGLSGAMDTAYDRTFAASDAQKEFAKATDFSTKATKGGGGAMRDASQDAKKLEDATDDVKDAEDELADAILKRSEIQKGPLANQVLIAEINARQAKRALIDAIEDEISATDALNEARADATPENIARAFEAATRDVAAADRDVERATIAVRAAQERLTAAQAAGDPAAIREAQLDLADAQDRVFDATGRAEDAHTDLRSAEELQAIAARDTEKAGRELEAAHDDVALSTIEVEDAEKDLTDTRAIGQEGSKELAAANDEVEAAQRRVEEATQRVRDLETEMNSARSGGGGTIETTMTVSEKLQILEDKGRAWIKSLEDHKAPASEVEAALKTIRDRMQEVADGEPEQEELVRRYFGTIKSEAGAALDTLQETLDKMNEINVLLAMAPELVYTPPSAATIPGHAAGGVASGLSIVGEQGPELAFFGSPAQIIPADKTKQMLGGNTVNLTINVNAPDRSTGDYAAAAVAASVRRELAVSLRGAVA